MHLPGANSFSTQAVLGEVLTVASMRYSRSVAIQFITDIIESKTTIVLENQELVDRALALFQSIKNKDVSWVDCYSFAIIERMHITSVFSFDKDFRRHAPAKVLD